jgi:hypothetical protein
MPSLSFDKTKGAKPIAMVKGGDDDGQVLYVNAEDDHKGKKPKLEINAQKYATELRSLKPQERIQLIHRLEEAHKKGLTPDQLVGETPLGKALYERVLADEAKSNKIDLPEGSEFVILPSPDPEKREVFYIAGASGSGKSYIARGIAECYKKLFPDRECYLLSKLGEDSTLDKLKFLKRLNIESFVEDYPTDLEEFRDCLIIFDDFDTFTGAYEKTILKLIDDLATMGRHTNTTMLVLSHYLTNYKKTRLILNEATHLVLYPMATSFHALSYLLKAHAGMSREDCRDLKKLGRWVCIFKQYPQWLLSKQHARLLNQD